MIEPELVRERVPLISEEQFNKFMAVTAVENTNVAFENFRYFSAICLALNNIVPNFTVVEVPEIHHIWYAVKEIKRIRPEMEFSHEVKEFIRIASEEEGYYIYPPELEIPSEYEHAVQALIDSDRLLTDNTTEEIQASKLLAISSYIARMDKNDRR